MSLQIPDLLTLFEGLSCRPLTVYGLGILATRSILDRIDSSQAKMHAELVWKWLDAVDQAHLDPLDQWGIPAPQQHPRAITPGSDIIPCNSGGKTDQQYNGEGNSDAASHRKSTPPSGILLRSGDIRIIGANSTSLAQIVENDKDSKAPHQQADASLTRQPQLSEREGNGFSIPRKKLPTLAGRACSPDVSGVLQPIPVVQIEAIDPVAVDCQGARVVGGYQRNNLQILQSETNVSRRHTTAEGAALHRSNAFKGHPKVRAASKGSEKR